MTTLFKFTDLQVPFREIIDNTNLLLPKQSLDSNRVLLFLITKNVLNLLPIPLLMFFIAHCSCSVFIAKSFLFLANRLNLLFVSRSFILKMYNFNNHRLI